MVVGLAEPSLGPHTLADWHRAEQPVDGSRLELLAGSWSVSPAPDAAHQYAGDELRELLKHSIRAAGRRDLWVVTAAGCGISTPRRDGTIPDIVMTQQRPAGLVPARSIELLVEIWSPGNTDRERIGKRAAYAAAGVPFFWEITTDAHGPVHLSGQHLMAGQYRADTRLSARNGSTTVAAAPVPVVVDFAALHL